jgi:hypothetical protein
VLATPATVPGWCSSGMYSFEGREWEVVTEAAKDMINQMLVMDITKRATAKQLLAHRWFQASSTRLIALAMPMQSIAGWQPCQWCFQRSRLLGLGSYSTDKFIGKLEAQSLSAWHSVRH